MKGYLWKSATSGKSREAKRYFKIIHTEEPILSKKACLGRPPNYSGGTHSIALCFWKSDKDIADKPIRVIYLDESVKVSQQSNNSTKRRYTIRLSVPSFSRQDCNDDIYLHTESSEDCKRWCKDINDVVMKRKEDNNYVNMKPLQASEEKVSLCNTTTHEENRTLGAQNYALYDGKPNTDYGYTSPLNSIYEYPENVDAFATRINSAPVKRSPKEVIPQRSNTEGRLPSKPPTEKKSDDISKDVRRVSLSINKGPSLDVEVGVDSDSLDLSCQTKTGDFENISVSVKYNTENDT